MRLLLTPIYLSTFSRNHKKMYDYDVSHNKIHGFPVVLISTLGRKMI